MKKEGYAFRQAVVDMVNILGAPIPCSCNKCEGCSYEMIEATRTGLIALGYLEETKFKFKETKKNAAGDDCDVWELDGPEPDGVEAWERFMKLEFNVTLEPDWRTKIQELLDKQQEDK